MDHDLLIVFPLDKRGGTRVSKACFVGNTTKNPDVDQNMHIYTVYRDVVIKKVPKL